MTAHTHRGLRLLAFYERKARIYSGVLLPFRNAGLGKEEPKVISCVLLLRMSRKLETRQAPINFDIKDMCGKGTRKEQLISADLAQVNMILAVAAKR